MARRFGSVRLLLPVLLVAAALRFIGLDWDQGHAVHPDERRISFALEELSFHPLQLNPHFFSYGSFPLYVQKAWTSAATGLGFVRDDFHGRILVTRALSALIGVAMVAWTHLLGARLYGARAALVAASLLAVSVLPIQHSHFITIDLWQAFLVLVTLERLAAFWVDGNRRAFFTAAVVVGLTLATKASSVPVLLPLFLTPLLRGGSAGIERRWTTRLADVIGAGFLVIAFFFLGQPYAFLDYPAFLRDVREQSTMVRNAGVLPYTIQYVGTRPWVDDLRQAFTWGMGPLLGVTAGIGTLAALARVARAPLTAELPLLLLFVPYFVITGWFPVKFMRYLLPLYPLWCLFAARLLAGPPERATGMLRKLVTALVIVATAAYALAFSSIYLRPHVWVAASRWFYGAVPQGSTVLTPHWDEGFPVNVEQFNPARYHRIELRLYEPDTDAKMAELAGQLAKGDAIVLQSKRLYGAITNTPSRFPRTVRFFELLFAGDLGYRLERVFASRPSLFGIELDDDFADESFSVYDHPKTLVFRKTLPLRADEIAERISSSVPSQPVTRAAMIGARLEGMPTPERSGATGIESSPLALAVWLVALSFVTSAGGRMLKTWLPRLGGAAAAQLGRPFGYLLFVYLCWLSVSLGVASFSPATTLVIAAALVLFARRYPRVESSTFAGSAVFYATFLFFVAVRSWTPEIFWGEKPMDFSFLNALYRTSSLPPPEPWMSGHAINYPYVGHFGVAALGKLTNVAPALAFNLGIATAAALTAAAAFGVGAAITGRAGVGVAAAIFVTLAGNLSGPYEMWSRRTIDFHYFWATSRVIPNTINEFPLWTFLFADLHAHVLALPLALLVTGLAVHAATTRSMSPRLLAVTSLSLGAIAVTSTWSWPVYCGALFGMSAIAALRDRRLGRVLFALAAIALSYVWFLPYWEHFVPPPRHWGWEDQSAPLTGVLAIFGAFLFVAFLAVGGFLRGRSRLLLRGALLLLLVAAAIHSSRAMFLVLALGCLIAALREDTAARSVAFTLGTGAMLLGAVAESVFLWDRMNTIFKLYLEMWLFLAVASAVWLFTQPRVNRGRWLRAAALGVLALVSAFTAVTDVIGALRSEHVRGPSLTLDGQAYLDVARPNDASAIEWLQENIAGTPVLLEAQSISYADFGRISMNTGLPTVLGWEYHLSQRAHPSPEIDRRKAVVRTIYNASSRDDVWPLLEEYGVALVYVGDLERREYTDAGLFKFEAWKDLFRPVYRNPGVQIYAVTPNFRWTETHTAVEEPQAVAAVESKPAAEPAPDVQQPAGELTQPRGIALDEKGNLWVADFGNHRIQVFDSSFELVRSFGRLGAGPAEFRQPCGVALGKDRVYVADTWNHRVQVLDREGEYLTEWKDSFFGPRGIAIAPDGSLWVTDTGNGRLVKFAPDGGVLARIGKKGSGTGEFDEPVGIAIGKRRVHVADARNRRIVVLDARGSVLEMWPVSWSAEAFKEPYLALLPDGRLVTSDPNGDRLLVFAPDGEVDREMELPKETGPAGMVALRDGTLYVSELKKHRVSSLKLR